MKREFKDFKEVEQNYKKAFTKCNVTASKLYDLQENYTITETKTEYHGRRIVSQETETITAWSLACVVSGCGFFRDRVTKSYTMAGYIVTRLSAKSPDGITRVVREYKYTYNR